MNLPGEQPPNIFTSFVRTRFRLMSCLIRKANCPTMSKQCNRVVQVSRFGDPDVIEVVDTPLPTAGPGEVRVRVLASSVEYTDVTIRRHVYAQTATLRPPFVLGYDVVGEIDQLGDGVNGFQLGDRVADMTVVGSNAAYRTLRASDLTRVPAGVGAAEAARADFKLDDRLPAPSSAGARAARAACACAGRGGGARSGTAGAWPDGRARSVGHCTQHARCVNPRARCNTDRLPAPRLHERPAWRIRFRLRRRWRGQLSS